MGPQDTPKRRDGRNGVAELPVPRVPGLVLKVPCPAADSGGMECFYHEGQPAVGSCRSCLKGLCRQCAAELEGGLACTGRCESMVEAVVATIQQGARYRAVSSGILQSARGLWLGLTFVSLFVGGFVILWGLQLPYYREIALLGVPFLALAFISARLARRVSASSETG